MNWWVWCLLGFLLLLAELATPGGFYLLFFGLGALVVGGLDFFDLSGPLWVQFLWFSAVSIALIAGFRGRMLRHFASGQKADIDSLVGERASAVEEIAAGGSGRVEMRGTAWKARNTGDSTIPAGQECTVEKVEGLVLIIRNR